jgi:hypothetical protein
VTTLLYLADICRSVLRFFDNDANIFKVKINAIHGEERSWRILSDCGSTSVHSKKYMKFHSHELWVKKVLPWWSWITFVVYVSPLPHHSGRYQLLSSSLFVCVQLLFVQFYLSFRKYNLLSNIMLFCYSYL